jgi:hypothetical protein
MKKVICMVIMLMVFIGTISAQTIEKTKRVRQEEVPAAVLKTFETSVGPLNTSDGIWTLHYTKYNADVPGRLKVKEVLTPIAYVFKNKSNKSEVRFNVDGKLESVKGPDGKSTHGE